jgi:hypothetical protein
MTAERDGQGTLICYNRDCRFSQDEVFDGEVKEALEKLIEPPYGQVIPSGGYFKVTHLADVFARLLIKLRRKGVLDTTDVFEVIGKR